MKTDEYYKAIYKDGSYIITKTMCEYDGDEGFEKWEKATEEEVSKWLSEVGFIM